jgi:digeranylgeranylglycerophospholipid reductase
MAAGCISKGDVRKDSLMPYDKGWRSSQMGKSLEKNYRIKEIFITLDDAKLNALIQSASRLDLKDFSVLTLVKELIQRNPKMLLELKSLYSVLK